MTASQPPRAHATVWVQIAPVWWPWHPASLKGLRVVRMTQKRPQRPGPGCVLVKLRIGLPEAAFLPPVVEGVVEAAAGEYDPQPLTVTAERLGGEA